MQRRAASFLFTVVALLLTFHPLHAQGPTVGLDGEAWVQLDTTQLGRFAKLDFLRGLYDGLVWGRSQNLSQYPTNASYETLVDGLDKFYSDFANRKILVVWALQVLALQLGGRPQAAVDSAVAYNRCLATALSPTMTPAQWRDRLVQCARPSAGH